MTLYPDLVRMLLLHVEGLSYGAASEFSFDDYDQATISEYMRQLGALGYVVANDDGKSIVLTWPGMVFLWAARNEADWARVKEKAAQTTISDLKAFMDEAAEEMACAT